MIVFLKIRVHLLMHSLKASGLRHHFLVLHEHLLHIILCHQRRFQIIILLIWLSLKDIHGELHHKVATCGIEI